MRTEKKKAHIIFNTTSVIDFDGIDFPKIFSLYFKMHFVYDLDYAPCFGQVLSLFHELLYDEELNIVKKAASYAAILEKLK